MGVTILVVCCLKLLLYLDLGCNDGVSNSNTYNFAMQLAWYGKCFEADANKYNEIRMRSGRRDAEHGAVSRVDGQAQFGVVNVPDGGLSGLSTTLDNARATSFGSVITKRVPTLTPRSILRRHYRSNSTIDYVSLDGERWAPIRL